MTNFEYPVSDSLRRMDLEMLVGLSVNDARRLVEAHGGNLRTMRAGQALSLTFQPSRVTVVTISQDEVLSVFGVG